MSRPRPLFAVIRFAKLAQLSYMYRSSPGAHGYRL